MSNDTPASVIGEGVGYSAVARLEARAGELQRQHYAPASA